MCKHHLLDAESGTQSHSTCLALERFPRAKPLSSLHFAALRCTLLQSCSAIGGNLSLASAHAICTASSPLQRCTIAPTRDDHSSLRPSSCVRRPVRGTKTKLTSNHLSHCTHFLRSMTSEGCRSVARSRQTCKVELLKEVVIVARHIAHNMSTCLHDLHVLAALDTQAYSKVLEWIVLCSALRKVLPPSPELRQDNLTTHRSTHRLRDPSEKAVGSIELWNNGHRVDKNQNGR